MSSSSESSLIEGDWSPEDDDIVLFPRKMSSQENIFEASLINYQKSDGESSNKKRQKMKLSRESSTTRPFKLTAENVRSKEAFKITSSGFFRKGKPKSVQIPLKMKDPKVRYHHRKDKRAEAVSLARVPNQGIVKFKKRKSTMYPVQNPKGKIFNPTFLSTTDDRDQTITTQNEKVDLFFTEYKSFENKTRYFCCVCYEELINPKTHKTISGTFGSLKSCRIHFRRLHGTESDHPYFCSTCSTNFPNNALLNEHLPSHSDVNTVKCTEESCDKYFSTESNMIHHWKQFHGGQESRPYICEEPDCHDSFANSSKLQRHYLCNHPTINTVSQCPICCKLCSQFGHLVKHIKYVHLQDGKLECETCGRKILDVNMKSHKLYHENNTDLYCSICEEILKDREAFIQHCNGKQHNDQFTKVFLSDGMTNFPHAIPLDEEDKKKNEFYSNVEYDELNKYDNPIFTACPRQKDSKNDCKACELIVVASTVYYLGLKWIVSVPKVPYTCKTVNTLYLALLEKNSLNGDCVQQRYGGQTQNSRGLGVRIWGHENGQDGVYARRAFLEEGWDHKYLFMYGCSSEKKEPLNVEFGERNLIRQFQCQDRPTFGVNTQDGGTLKFIMLLNEQAP